jgi:methylmalonyl-CoA mutase N-terminal domain/subunit
MKQSKESLKQWEKTTLKKVLDRSPERQEEFATESGIPVKRLYSPQDLEGMDYDDALGYPGQYPYTRGVYPSMYRGRLWTMRNYAGFGTAEDTNHRFRYLLDQGMKGLSIAFDLPTQLGYDSDDPLAEGAVGRVGVAVDTLADMEIIFQGIPAHHVPRWNTLNITGYHFREAGANAIQELAFTLADAITYIEKAQERGLDVDYFAPRLSYSLGCYMDFFEEIAKYRAARRLYAKIMQERFQTENPKSQLFRIFTGSCGSTLVPQQPINNIVRVAMHALMGILGGNQAIHTACWDEGYAIPSEDSARIALRTQQILAHECGLGNTIDPLAGSYFLESLTNEIEQQAAAYLHKIDAMGGMLGAIENGYVFKEIQED